MFRSLLNLAWSGWADADPQAVLALSGMRAQRCARGERPCTRRNMVPRCRWLAYPQSWAMRPMGSSECSKRLESACDAHLGQVREHAGPALACEAMSQVIGSEPDRAGHLRHRLHGAVVLAQVLPGALDRVLHGGMAKRDDDLRQRGAHQVVAHGQLQRIGLRWLAQADHGLAQQRIRRLDGEARSLPGAAEPRWNREMDAQILAFDVIALAMVAVTWMQRGGLRSACDAPAIRSPFLAPSAEVVHQLQLVMPMQRAVADAGLAVGAHEAHLVRLGQTRQPGVGVHAPG